MMFVIFQQRFIALHTTVQLLDLGFAARFRIFEPSNSKLGGANSRTLVACGVFLRKLPAMLHPELVPNDINNYFLVLVLHRSRIHIALFAFCSNNKDKKIWVDGLSSNAPQLMFSKWRLIAREILLCSYAYCLGVQHVDGRNTRFPFKLDLPLYFSISELWWGGKQRRMKNKLELIAFIFSETAPSETNIIYVFAGEYGACATRLSAIYIQDTSLICSHRLMPICLRQVGTSTTVTLSAAKGLVFRGILRLRPRMTSLRSRYFSSK